MNKSLPTEFVLAAVLFLTGCAAHEGAYRPRDVAVGNLENEALFVLLDPSAQRSVTCSGMQQTRLEDGRLRIKANLRNRENRRIQLQVNCVFKDTGGFALEETAFSNLFLDENATQGTEFVSMNNQPQRYTMRVREAR